MKPLAHVIRLALGLGLAGLFAGCVSSDYRTARRIEPASDFEVVETSARRPLTGKEMAELRGTVARYLDQQGETGSGDYYLKVYLTPEVEGVTPEWVVVRFTRYSDVRVNVASTDPAYDYYPYSPSYYSYDTYPYGYDSFGRISFQYYDDPFYGRRYYYPRHDHRRWDRDRNHQRPDGDHDHKPGDHRPPEGVVTTPSPRPENPRRRTPDRIAPANQPRPEQVGRNRDDKRRTPGRPETAPAYSRPVNPAAPSPSSQPDRQQWRGRNENNSGTAYNQTRPPNPPRAEARNETRTYTPPPQMRTEQRYTPSSNNNSSSSDRREVRDDGKRSGNQP